MQVSHRDRLNKDIPEPEAGLYSGGHGKGVRAETKPRVLLPTESPVKGVVAALHTVDTERWSQCTSADSNQCRESSVPSY